MQLVSNGYKLFQQKAIVVPRFLYNFIVSLGERQINFTLKQRAAYNATKV